MDVGLEKGGAKRVQDLARERGLLILMAGHGDVVRFTPPLTVKAEEVDICADIVESCVEIIQEDE
jgi:4-aminobutyrate aminotransferase-like enzyme